MSDEVRDAIARAEGLLPRMPAHPQSHVAIPLWALRALLELAQVVADGRCGACYLGEKAAIASYRGSPAMDGGPDPKPCARCAGASALVELDAAVYVSWMTSGV